MLNVEKQLAVISVWPAYPGIT